MNGGAGDLFTLYEEVGGWNLSITGYTKDGMGDWLRGDDVKVAVILLVHVCTVWKGEEGEDLYDFFVVLEEVTGAELDLGTDL